MSSYRLRWGAANQVLTMEPETLTWSNEVVKAVPTT